MSWKMKIRKQFELGCLKYPLVCEAGANQYVLIYSIADGDIM